MTQEYGNILVERRGRVGLVTLNRPEALNALNRATLDELVAAVSAMDADPGVGAERGGWVGVAAGVGVSVGVGVAASAGAAVSAAAGEASAAGSLVSSAPPPQAVSASRTGASNAADLATNFIEAPFG